MKEHAFEIWGAGDHSPKPGVIVGCGVRARGAPLVGACCSPRPVPMKQGRQVPLVGQRLQESKGRELTGISLLVPGVRGTSEARTKLGVIFSLCFGSACRADP